MLRQIAAINETLPKSPLQQTKPVLDVLCKQFASAIIRSQSVAVICAALD